MESPPGPARDATDHGPKWVRRHIEELDGLRGIAILCVFLHHYVAVEPGTHFLQKTCVAALRSLWCGVDLFFVLSGFLITGILLDTRSDGSYFKTFFARRSIRIFPPYFALLAVTLLVLPRWIPFDTPGDRLLLANQGWLWCYATNLRVMVTGFGPFVGDQVGMAHLWSLAVEEHFYLVWPWVVYAVSPRRLRWVCLACFAGALALRVGLLATPAPPEASYVATPCRIDAMAIGGMVALLIRDAGADLTRFRRMAAIALAFTGPALLALFGWRRGLFYQDPFTSTIGYSLLAIFSAALILAAVSFDPAGPFRGFLRLGPLRSMGKYSYGFYLYHAPLEPWLMATFSTSRFEGALGVPALVAVLFRVATAFVVCFGVAFLSWHLFERPILGLKRRFEYARPG